MLGGYIMKNLIKHSHLKTSQLIKTLFLLMILIVVLSGCFSVENIVNDVTDSVNEGLDKIDNISSIIDSYNGSLAGDDIYVDKNVSHLASENRIWIEFSRVINNNFTKKSALIDTDGKILWECQINPDSTGLIETSNFKDGLAYCLFKNDNKLQYMIFDSDGNVTYTRDKDDNFILLGHGDGLFLAAEHIIDFERNEWQIGAIDKNGNTVVPFKVYKKDPPPGPDPVEKPSGPIPDPNYNYWAYLEYYEQLDAYEAYSNYSFTPEAISFDTSSTPDNQNIKCEYMGDNIYKIGPESNFWYVLLNLDSQSIIYTYDRNYTSNPLHNFYDGGIVFLTNFENGTAKVLHKYQSPVSREEKNVVSTITEDGVITTIIDNYWTNNILSRSDVTFNDGLVCVNSTSQEFPSGYYDLEGNRLIDFPEYNDRIYVCYPFIDGYACINIEGSDGYAYFTVIDKDKNFLFDPVRNFAAYGCLDGKYILTIKKGCVAIFNTDGHALVSAECSCISSTDREILLDNNMLQVKDVFINLDTGIVIGQHADNTEMIITDRR